jgi:hypothetical protein
VPDEQLNAALTELGAALGQAPRAAETGAQFARRCTEAARRLRLGAGVTWADYELVKADKGTATFALKQPPEHLVLGGPRWVIKTSQGLDELAGQLGMYEDRP